MPSRPILVFLINSNFVGVRFLAFRRRCLYSSTMLKLSARFSVLDPASTQPRRMSSISTGRSKWPAHACRHSTVTSGIRVWICRPKFDFAVSTWSRHFCMIQTSSICYSLQPTCRYTRSMMPPQYAAYFPYVSLMMK